MNSGAGPRALSLGSKSSGSRTFARAIVYHELNAMDVLRRVAIDDRHILRSERLQLGAPTRVGNFYAQHSFMKLDGSGTLGHRGAAGQGPRQHGSLFRRGAPQRVTHDFLQASGSAFHGAPPDSRREKDS